MMEKHDGFRYKWIDVSKAIAMIFVYLGHWTTVHLESFAYSFHLQTFFVVAGFFALKQRKVNIKKFLNKQLFSIVLPYFLWVLISFTINNIDNSEVGIKEFSKIIISPMVIQPNYWFFPSFFAVTFCYYILLKFIDKPLIILIIAFVSNIFFGEIPFLYKLPDFKSLPFALQVLNNWFSFLSVPHFLFWYALGAYSFDRLPILYKNLMKKNLGGGGIWKILFIIFSISGLISMILFFKNTTNINTLSSIIYMNNFTLETYRIITTIIIMIFIFGMSKLLEESVLLNNIGKSSMNFMGLEYITHGFFALTFLPMINLGIPTLTSTMQIITITIIQIFLNLYISNKINKYFKFLNGDYKK